MDKGRVVTTHYNAHHDAAARHPGWRLAVTDLHGIPEVICTHHKVILVDKHAWSEGADFALAHALAHLDLGHVDEPEFTDEHEQQADYMAQVRLDRPLW
jgi:hypothetical protein